MTGTAILEWDGKDYELRYTFSVIRRMRAEEINFPQAFRAIIADAQAVADYGDVVASTVAFLLRDAGCPGVTAEEVWRRSLSIPGLQSQCIGLFMWIGTQHFAQSENVPTKKQVSSPTN